MGRLCKRCNKEFELKSKFHPKQKYCTDKCRGLDSSERWNAKNPEKRKQIVYNQNRKRYKNEWVPGTKKNCLHCNEEFEVRSKFKPDQKYCTDKCNNRAKSKRHYHKNVEKSREYAANWRSNNTEKVLAAKDKYYHSDKGKANYTRKNIKRRSKLKESIGVANLTADIIAELHKKYPVCAYCNREFTTSGKGKRNIDHVLPLAKGGPSTMDNLVVACAECNKHKQDKLLYFWYQTDYCKKKNIGTKKKH